MTTRLLVGDVFARMAELPDASFDLIVTSPPFLCLRSYLPDDHPQKHLEIGSEATPADYLDTLLALTAEWRRLLAPHGSLAVELGDTYAGSGGAGGDYNEDGYREGQGRFSGSAAKRRTNGVGDEYRPARSGRDAAAWPLDKSLTGIPTIYAWSLAYGRNLLTGQPSPAGKWRVRNLKPWIRSNPPVGALGDKERPATSYITVACVSSARWFDLDAVRTPAQVPDAGPYRGRMASAVDGGDMRHVPSGERGELNAGGAPPLDWWHHVDAVIDTVIDQLAGRNTGGHHVGQADANWSMNTSKSKDPGRGGNWATFDEDTSPRATNSTFGARGKHVRRALETAGILQRGDFYDVSPKGYAGAHYAVWPPELVRLLIDEMCPRKVCAECGLPSRRLTEASYGHDISHANGRFAGEKLADRREASATVGPQGMAHGRANKHVQTVGWSDCGCPGDHWRPGRVLDPFSGSGTTLAVASGMGRDSVGIDLDPRNADLTLERVGMFLEIDYGTKEATA